MKCVYYIITFYIKFNKYLTIVTFLLFLFSCYFEYLLNRNILETIVIIDNVFTNRVNIYIVNRTLDSLITNINKNDKR